MTLLGALVVFLHLRRRKMDFLDRPCAGSWVERIDPLRFLVKRWTSQAGRPALATLQSSKRLSLSLVFMISLDR